MAAASELPKYLIDARIATKMSSIATLAARRALTRQTMIRAPPRRFMTSKVEEANLDKAPKRDPELYVHYPYQTLALVATHMLNMSLLGSSGSYVGRLPDCWLVSSTHPLFMNLQAHCHSFWSHFTTTPVYAAFLCLVYVDVSSS